MTTVIDPNVIDFENLSALIAGIAGIFPGIITLVVSIIPLYIVQGLIYLVLGIFGGLVASFAHMWSR